MTRVERVVEQVKQSRKGNFRPWIYDNKGRIKDNVLCGDVLELLEELKEYEISVTDEYIDRFIKQNEDKGYNTYNYGARVSNDLNYFVYETDDVYIIAMAVHLYGDIRDGYSEYFVVKFDNYYEWFELDSKIQHKRITEDLWAEIDIMRELYEVYDYKNMKSVGEFYAVEIEDLLKQIEEERLKVAQ